MRQIAALTVVILVVLVLAACGGSDSSATNDAATTTATATAELFEKVPTQALRVARKQANHNRIWERAYRRWDKGYRSNSRAAFLSAARTQTPIMERESDAAYRTALTTNDPGLRTLYARQAKWYLRQTETISRFNDYVTLGDLSHAASQLRKLDRVIAEGRDLGEKFQNYVQRRFGYNVFSDLTG